MTEVYKVGFACLLGLLGTALGIAESLSGWAITLIAAIPAGLICSYKAWAKESYWEAADAIHSIILLIPQLKPVFESMI